MSFMLTVKQVRSQSKYITRRLGWKNLKPGDEIMACEKCQGIPKGETMVRISPLKIISNRPEALRKMIDDPLYGMLECVREGFPCMTPKEFVEMFCKHNDCTPETIVNRIQFDYL